MVLHILVLSVGSFAVGTGTFVVTGVLTDIAEALSVSVANAGLLVTVFAVTFAVGSPLLVSAASGVERRRLLAGALVVFALANVVAALAPSFSVLLGARVLAACGAAIFTPVFAFLPLQQYRLIEVAPPEGQNTALSLNASAIQAGQGIGAGLGAFALHYGSVGDLGWVGALCAVGAFAALGFQGRSSPL